MREFCQKLSCNSKTFLELGSQDPPLFAGLVVGGVGWSGGGAWLGCLRGGAVVVCVLVLGDV